MHKILFFGSVSINVAATANVTTVPTTLIPEPAQEKVVAIADLHGDIASMRLILQATGIATFDKQGKPTWTGGTTVLVSTGDSVDRGRDSFEIYKVYMDLYKQAQAHGGNVINLLGNHELMNLQNDLRYVAQSEYATYGGEAARKVAWKPDGIIGQDLHDRYKAAAVVNGSLFVHGGLHPDFLKAAVHYYQQQHPGQDTPDALTIINNKMQELMSRFPVPSYDRKDMLTTILVGGHGPFWNRFFAEEQDETHLCSVTREVLDLVGAKRMVMGHTPQVQGITSRCGGQIILADTVISSAYKPAFGFHRPSALLIDGDDLQAIYLDEENKPYASILEATKLEL